jgi:hypothetical protein
VGAQLPVRPLLALRMILPASPGHCDETLNSAKLRPTPMERNESAPHSASTRAGNDRHMYRIAFVNPITRLFYECHLIVKFTQKFM